MDDRQSSSRDHGLAKEVFDHHAEGYSDTIDAALRSYGASHDFFTRHKARLIDQLLAKRGRRSEDMDLLDVGCGVGNIHELIGPHFRSVTGIDVSSASIEAAKARFPVYAYKAYDGGRLPVPDASMDLAMAICVFHHVPPAEWKALAVDMLRVLRPGGMALVIEHNPWNPVTRRIVSNCPIDRDAVLLTRSRTAELFRSAGAASVVCRSILSVPPISRPMMALDMFLGALPFGAQYYCLATRTGQTDVA